MRAFVLAAFLLGCAASPATRPDAAPEVRSVVYVGSYSIVTAEAAPPHEQGGATVVELHGRVTDFSVGEVVKGIDAAKGPVVLEVDSGAASSTRRWTSPAASSASPA